MPAGMSSIWSRFLSMAIRSKTRVMKRSVASSKVTIGLIQSSCSPDLAANLRKTFASIEKAAKRGAQIICTQELFRSQYFCQSEDHDYFKLAESIPGPTTAAMQKLAKKHSSCHHCVIVRKAGRRAFITTRPPIIDADGSLLGIYRKMHIPDDPLYYEKFYFTPGDLGFRAWQTKYGKIGVLICWDQWYPEGGTPDRHARSGNSLLSRPPSAGIRGEKGRIGERQHDAWELIQRSHAVANGCYVAVPNRIGLEKPVGGDGIEFWGQSFVAGTSGQLLAKASSDKEETLIVPLDLAKWT